MTPGEVEEVIERAAELIINKGMDNLAILMLEGAIPLVYIGGQLGRVTIAPISPLFGFKMERFITVFENRENIRRLINLIEQKKEPKSEKENGLKNQKNSFWFRLRSRLKF